MYQEDLTGQKFGKLTVLEYAGMIKSRSSWKCQCECGNTVVLSISVLKSGHTKSCGCLTRKYPKENLVGKRFGRLTVIEYAERKNSKEYLKCKCDCGNTTVLCIYALRSGNTKSCGCLQKEAREKNRFKDLTGQVFGYLTAIEIARKEKGRIYWKCKCKCGNEVNVFSSSLIRGKTKSCGCKKKEPNCNLVDLTDMQFGKLKVLRKLPPKNSCTYWLCQCECGNIIKVNSVDLRHNKTTHCGCERINLESKTRLYRIYKGMISRCFNSKNKQYHFYGGRGITVCDEWMNVEGFFTFKNWALSHNYQDNLTIDRIDNDGNYEPNNCRWVSMKIQNNNKRSNVYLEYKNEIHTISEWADISNIKASTIYRRLSTGHSVKESIETPAIRFIDRENKEIRKEIKDNNITYYDIAEKINVRYRTFTNWMQKPLTEEKERQVKEAIQIIVQERNVSNGN